MQSVHVHGKVTMSCDLNLSIFGKALRTEKSILRVCVSKVRGYNIGEE